MKTFKLTGKESEDKVPVGHLADPIRKVVQVVHDGVLIAVSIRQSREIDIYY